MIQQILDAAYEKAVEPHLSVLKSYENGTGEIYGEVLKPLIDDIINQTGITSKSLFVDLGSGFGNVVLHVAFETDCETRGIELRKELFPIAKAFQKDIERRSKAVFHAYDHCVLLQGDFIDSEEVDRWIENADVVFTTSNSTHQ